MSHLYAQSSVSDQRPLVIVLPSRTHNAIPINKCTLNFLPNFHPCQWLESSRTKSLALLGIIPLLILVDLFSFLGCYLRNNLTPVTKPDFCQANHRLPGNGFARLRIEQREAPPYLDGLNRPMH